MIQWRFDDLRQDNFTPWFMPPPPQLRYSNNNSPMNSFFDYIYPVVDRLSPSFNGNNSYDFLYPYGKRQLRIENFVIKPNKISKTFNREYDILSCLGKGGFGEVYDGRRRSNNSSVVIKILAKDRILNWGTFLGKRVPFEIELLWRFRGVPGIIRIFEHFEEPDRYIFTMEKIPNASTLFDFVTASPPLANTELLRHIFRELVRINITLQSYGIWHRDCKPENVLYCETDRSLRFIDFGSAAAVQSEDFHEFQGTLEIMVPEWILEKRYNGEQSCVWTLGVCLYFLLFQQYPFRSKVDIVNGRSRLPFLDSPDKEAFQTMRQCLHRHGHRRPTLNSLLQSSWLN